MFVGFVGLYWKILGTAVIPQDPKQVEKLEAFTLYLNTSVGIEVIPVHPLNEVEKLVTAVLYLNKSVGMEVIPAHKANTPAKVVTAVLYLNKSIGIDVKEVQDWKQETKLVAAVLYLNKSIGIDVKEVQDWKQAPKTPTVQNLNSSSGIEVIGTPKKHSVNVEIDKPLKRSSGIVVILVCLNVPLMSTVTVIPVNKSTGIEVIAQPKNISLTVVIAPVSPPGIEFRLVQPLKA